MRKILINLMLCVAVTGVFTACDKEMDNELLMPDETTAEKSDGTVSDGYFRATFFPQQGDNALTRAAVQGESMAIQSLVCLIYQKQDDDSYTYYAEESVITYNGTPQSYMWPLQEEVVFDNLPNGEYKAVFVGNTDKTLFDGVAGDLLTDYQNDIKDSRLNMPENEQGQPLVFNDNNMFYLCTVDFSDENPSPHVLMQRVVAQNVYGRDMINSVDDVDGLVESVIEQIKQGQLTEDIVRGLLEGALQLLFEDPVYEPLFDLLGGVDALLEILLGEVLNQLYNQLLDPVTEQLENAILGTGNSSLLGLGYILNPWTMGMSVDVSFSKFPKSIDFTRETTDYYEGDDIVTLVEQVQVDKEDNINYVTVHSLCGDIEVEALRINENSYYLLGPLFEFVDEAVLSSLLIDIDNRPLEYSATSNLQYSARFRLVGVQLNGSQNPSEEDDEYKKAHSDDVLQLEIHLRDIVELEELLENLLINLIIEKNPLLGPVLTSLEALGLPLKSILESLLGSAGLGGILGAVGGSVDGLLDTLLGGVTDIVNELLIALDIRLPGLNLSEINVTGGWSDYIEVSNGEHISLK